MDKELRERLNEVLAKLRTEPVGISDDVMADPVAQMMLVALLNETQKIHDYTKSVTQRLVERYCADFIPRDKVDAVPAITLVNPRCREGKDSELFTVDDGAIFTLRDPAKKMQVNYIPLFCSVGVPVFVSPKTKSEHVALVTHRMVKAQGVKQDIAIESDSPSSVYLCVGTRTEVECLKGWPLLIKGTGGMAPERIFLVNGEKELEFATMREMENIEMAYPFDAQQASGEMFSYMKAWKENLLDMQDATLIYITDNLKDRDAFKPRPFPPVLSQWLESETIDSLIDSNCGNLWLRLDFPKGFVVSDRCEVLPNVMPVVNVDVCSLMLTQATPIAKLNKQENAFFLRLLETTTAANKNGFLKMSDEVIVRDFDALCYNNGELYRDVRNLYNRYIDDYYAFAEFNSIKDGETLRKLRECINSLGKSVSERNEKFLFDSGTFVMKNISSENSNSTIKVSYITTLGALGNEAKAKQMLECRKMPQLQQKAEVVMDAVGGVDKASADGRYEQLRYYALTADRLYTRMDVEAFLRKEIMEEFGSGEFRRIRVNMRIEGTAGARALRRGLYIDIEFKDAKNYQHAVTIGFATLMQQRIQNKACLSMPVIIKLVNLE